MGSDETESAAADPSVDDATPRSQRITTPCPPSPGEHTTLLADLDAALAVARWSMARFRADRDGG